VVEGTRTSVEFWHNYDDFDRLNRFCVPLEGCLSLHLSVKSGHILQSIQVTRKSAHYIGLETVPGYLASVRFGTTTETPVLIRNFQGNHSGSLAPGCYQGRTETECVVSGLKPDPGFISRC